MYPTNDNVRRDQAREGQRRLSAPPKKPFVAKGHDAILKRLQDSGDQVHVTLMSGDTVSGKITARDKYTITVNNGVFAVTIYKHAIELFYEVSKVTQ